MSSNAKPESITVQENFRESGSILHIQDTKEVMENQTKTVFAEAAFDVLNNRYDDLFTYACDDVQYARKDKPEAWTTVKEAGVKMFYSYPYFSFIPGTQGDNEPVRFGDFVIDIDSKELAMNAAIKIMDWFASIYNVDVDQWRVYLSGKKGVHLELPAEILGMEVGHKLLPLGYKRLAKDIEGELHLALDTSMYNRGTGKPYRRPNIMRLEGTCKRQITYDDLFGIASEEEYQAACSEAGPVWEPEDVERNQALYSKVWVYLQDAVAQQEAINLAPEFTEEESARMKNLHPPCIKVLSRLTMMTGKKKANFNEVAIQLTATALSCGLTELEFLSGCSIFIANYPSSSLTTAQKRYENCRARYRTMAANGNQHSCGGILALGIPGFDCKECELTAAASADEEKVEVMSAEDLKDKNLSLFIPLEISRPGGLIDLGMKALSAPGMPNIEQYNLPVVLTTIANAIAGKITFRDKWPNVYNIKVGPTSSGKTDSDKTMINAIRRTNGLGNFYSVTDFASGPALMRGMVADPITMIVIDEATSLFKRYEKNDAIGDGKRDALLELFSKSGQWIKKVYADSRNTFEIDTPCLSLTGNATPTIFDAIKEEDFNTGTMQRFDFWCYDGPVPERGVKESNDNKELTLFAEEIAKIRAAMPIDGGNLCGMNVGRYAPYELKIDDAANARLYELSKSITGRINETESEGERGIISREYDLVIKYAMIHLAATRPIEEMFSPIREEDIIYGKSVARMLSDWKRNVLKNKVTTGHFHQMCEIFLKARDAAQQNNKRPTLAVMAHRRPQMKNWKTRESAEVIDVLLERGEIIKDESKKPPAYFRPKQGLSA